MMDMAGAARMMGITPEQMQVAQQLGQHVRMVIKKNRAKGIVEIRYIPTDDQMAHVIPNLIDNLVNQVSQGHYTLFGMQGEIQTVREG